VGRSSSSATTECISISAITALFPPTVHNNSSAAASLLRSAQSTCSGLSRFLLDGPNRSRRCSVAHKGWKRLAVPPRSWPPQAGLLGVLRQLLDRFRRMQTLSLYFSRADDAGSGSTPQAFGDRQWRARHWEALSPNERGRSFAVNNSDADVSRSAWAAHVMAPRELTSGAKRMGCDEGVQPVRHP
jgi:hypothetical protein